MTLTARTLINSFDKTKIKYVHYEHDCIRVTFYNHDQLFIFGKRNDKLEFVVDDYDWKRGN